MVVLDISRQFSHAVFVVCGDVCLESSMAGNAGKNGDGSVVVDAGGFEHGQHVSLLCRSDTYKLTLFGLWFCCCCCCCCSCCCFNVNKLLEQVICISYACMRIICIYVKLGCLTRHVHIPRYIYVTMCYVSGCKWDSESF